jgi:hypothetical protein
VPEPITYRARLLDIHDRGTRLEPEPGTAVPDQPTDVNMLTLAVAHALGIAGYEHHPEPRDTELQTLDALLAGEAAMPWRPDRARDAGQHSQNSYLVCERQPSGAWRCRVESAAG